MAVTATQGVVELRGQKTAGLPNGTLGGAQISLLNAGCGAAQNLAHGVHIQAIVTSPLL